VRGENFLEFLSKFWTPTCDRAIRTGINHQDEDRGTSGDAAKAVLTR
jgi:hypothetical protein